MLDIICVDEYDDGYHFNGGAAVKRKLSLLGVRAEHNGMNYTGTGQFNWLIVPGERKQCTGFAFVSDDRHFQVAYPSEVAEEIYNTLDIKFDEHMTKLLT